MVIIFQSDKARNHLLAETLVYTFRTKERKRTGNDWMTDRRGGTKIANVDIEPLEYFFHRRSTSQSSHRLREFLSPYVSQSGFSSVDGWIREILRLNRAYPIEGWLYRVSLRGSR